MSITKLKNYNGKKFYTGRKAWDSNAPWIIAITPRSVGKSLWYIKEFIIDFFNNGHKLAYVRRSDTEVKQNKVDLYFSDPNLIKWLNTAGYSSIKCFSSALWLMRVNPDTGKENKAMLIGYSFSLSTQANVKSLHYDCYNFVLEEFITAGAYLPNERMLFDNVIYTACRDGIFRAVLLGNTIARDCPYLLDFGIDLGNAKENTITEYKIKKEDGSTVKCIFDYYVPESKKTFFFGTTEKNIVQGKYVTDEQPKLFFEITKNNTLHHFIFITKLKRAYHIKVLLYEKYNKCEKYLYVYPCKYENYETYGCDIFTDTFSDKYYMHPKKKKHKKIMELIRKDHVLFSDNLTGTEFKNQLKRYNPFI